MIRPVTLQDVPTLKSIIDANDLFPATMLDEMMASYFEHSDSQEIWLTDEIDGEPVAIAYCAPERMTEDTWNRPQVCRIMKEPERFTANVDINKRPVFESFINMVRIN